MTEDSIAKKSIWKSKWLWIWLLFAAAAGFVAALLFPTMSRAPM
jgi:hypothetical protein